MQLFNQKTIFSPLCKFFKSEVFLEKFPRTSLTGVFFKGHHCLLASLEEQPVHSWKPLGRAEDVPPPRYPLPQHGTVAKIFKTHPKTPALEATSNIWYFVAFLKPSYQKPLIAAYFSVNIFATHLTKNYHHSITLANIDHGTPPTTGGQWLGPCNTPPPPSSAWGPGQQHTRDVLKIKPQTPSLNQGFQWWHQSCSKNRPLLQNSTVCCLQHLKDKSCLYLKHTHLFMRSYKAE